MSDNSSVTATSTDASESQEEYVDPSMCWAPSVLGNYTTDAETHLWCADALASVINGSVSVDEYNEDIQEALNYLLAAEISRAKFAQMAEAKERMKAFDTARENRP